MNAEPGESFHQELAVESLARESNVPIDDVAGLYQRELTRVGFGARIGHFVPIFAIRNVRAILRRDTESKGLGTTGTPGV